MRGLRSFKIILIVMAICSFSIFVADYFLFRDIKIKNEHISSLENDLSLQDKRQEYLVSTQKLVKSVEQDIANINNSIIPKQNDVKFIEGIETMAKDNNLKIEINSLFTQNDEVASTTATILSMKVKTTGGWSGTYKFLAEIESLPFKIKIGNMTMYSSNIGGDGAVVAKKTASVWEGSFDIKVLEYK